MSSFTYAELKQKSNIYQTDDLVENLGFEKSLLMARAMLSNKEWDTALHEYATKLLEEMEKKYPEKWNSSWMYDALLGYAYDIIYKYDEKYAAFKKAFKKINPPPPQLLVAMASCCWAPGKPPLKEDEAIQLVKEAIKNTLYVEGVELLKGLYKSMGNIKEEEHWEGVLESIINNGEHLPSLDQLPEIQDSSS